MEINLVVSYDPQGGYVAGKIEVHAILEKLGDKESEQELIVPGIIAVQTELKARDVIEDARELYMSDPSRFNFTLKWVPVEHWCEGTLEAITATVKREIASMIAETDQYAIDVAKHRSELHKEQVIEAIAPLIKGKVNLDKPQKIVRIELFGDKASVSLLVPKNIFSVVKGQ